MVNRGEISVDGRPTVVWTGGNGDALLLLHGAWAGAEAHWAPVWERLAEAHRVVAPDFPGLADDSAWVPRSFRQAVRWVEQALDGTDAPRAWIVGNSFGAALAARLASQSPERCLGLVLVDGGPPPTMPSAVRALVQRWPVRPVVEEIFRRSSYGSSTLRRAFADPDKAPAEMRAVVTQRRPRQFDVVSEIILAGDPPVPAPRVRTLIVWGADDHLAGSTVKTAQRLQQSLPDARLVTIPDAGHLPQVEQPDVFVRAVLEFAKPIS
jgi:pimeloyl-ACP methyl ester carboxylesterase